MAPAIATRVLWMTSRAMKAKTTRRRSPARRTRNAAQEGRVRTWKTMPMGMGEVVETCLTNEKGCG